MASLRLIKASEKNAASEEELGGQMSFLEHLDELRTRLIRSIVFVFVAAFFCLRGRFRDFEADAARWRRSLRSFRSCFSCK